MSYHFFAASLPMLHLGAPPPLPPDHFVTAAREHLSPNDTAALDALAEGTPSHHPFVTGWRHYETQLRNAVARLRATRLGADSSPWLRPHEGYDVALEHGVVAAFQEPDPLRRERALDAILWHQAGELAGLDAFSAAALFAYFIRLQLAARGALRDTAQGRARRQALVDTASAPSTYRTKDAP